MRCTSVPTLGLFIKHMGSAGVAAQRRASVCYFASNAAAGCRLAAALADSVAAGEAGSGTVNTCVDMGELPYPILTLILAEAWPANSAGICTSTRSGEMYVTNPGALRPGVSK